MSEVAQTPRHTLAIPSLSDEVHLQILSIPGLAGIPRRLWYFAAPDVGGKACGLT